MLGKGLWDPVRMSSLFFGFDFIRSIIFSSERRES